MATRFYLPSAGTAPLASLARDSGWTQPTSGVSAARLPMDIQKTNTALTTTTITEPSTSTNDWCWWQFQSRPISGSFSFTTSHTFSMVVGQCAETSNGGNAHLAYSIRVVSNDGSTIRGVLKSSYTTITEYALVASAATRIIASGVLAANVSASDGDRIILEIGIHGVTPAAENMQMRIGDPIATADFALTSGLTTDLCSWAELSATVPFKDNIVSASDSFTGSNGTNLGTYSAKWAPNSDAAMVVIQNNSAACGTSTTGLAHAYHWAFDVVGADQFSQATITGTDPVFSQIGVSVRVNIGSTRSFYDFYGSTFSSEFVVTTNGTESRLTSTGSAWALNDVVRIQVVGTTINALVNGSVWQTATDATFASGAPGLATVNNTSGTGLARLDDWTGGTYAVTTITLTATGYVESPAHGGSGVCIPAGF